MGRARRIRPDRLRHFREQRKLTQHDLATQLRERGYGTNQVTVSRWESGQAPHSSVLPHLAAALGVTVEQLCEDEESEAASLMPLAADPNSVLEALYGAIGHALNKEPVA